MSRREIPMCGYDGCTNLADPRFYAYCKHGVLKMVCDAHLFGSDVPREERPVEHDWTPYRNPCDCGELHDDSRTA
jgi:hypothetical protein